MRTRYWVCLATAALCLTGCSGFWNAPSNGGGGGGGTTLSSGDIYVINSATSQLVALYVNAGTMSTLPGSPYTLAAAPQAITVAPNNAFLYVSTLGGIFVYAIDASTGRLTVGNSGQPISSDPATSMQVDSTNSWLVEGVSGSANLFAIHVNPSNGQLQSNQITRVCWWRWDRAERRRFLSTRGMQIRLETSERSGQKGQLERQSRWHSIRLFPERLRRVCSISERPLRYRVPTPADYEPSTTVRRRRSPTRRSR